MTPAEKIKQLVAQAMDIADELNEMLPALDSIGKFQVERFTYAVNGLDDLEEYLVEEKR